MIQYKKNDDLKGCEKMSLNEILVTEVKGVGKAMVEKLAQLKIVTVKDLLEYFPYRYENYELIDIHHAMHEEKLPLKQKSLQLVVFNIMENEGSYEF